MPANAAITLAMYFRLIVRSPRTLRSDMMSNSGCCGSTRATAARAAVTSAIGSPSARIAIVSESVGRLRQRPVQRRQAAVEPVVHDVAADADDAQPRSVADAQPAVESARRPARIFAPSTR